MWGGIVRTSRDNAMGLIKPDSNFQNIFLRIILVDVISNPTEAAIYVVIHQTWFRYRSGEPLIPAFIIVLFEYEQ